MDACGDMDKKGLFKKYERRFYRTISEWGDVVMGCVCVACVMVHVGAHMCTVSVRVCYGSD